MKPLGAAAAILVALLISLATPASANHDGDKHGKQLAECIDGDPHNTYGCM